MTAAVLGVGRFGRLWAEILSKIFQVYVYDHNSTGALPPDVQVLPLSQVARCDYVFLCVPISALRDCLCQLSSYLQSGTVLIDTCSVKMYPAQCMRDLIAHDIHLIGTHPLFGPDSKKRADPPVVLCKVRADQKIYERFRIHIEQLGLVPVEMGEKEHDKLLAYTQGLTHLIGRVVHRLSLPSSSTHTIGYALLQDLVEQTCNDSIDLFLDMQHYNEFSKYMRQHLTKAYEDIIYMIDEYTQPNHEQYKKR